MINLYKVILNNTFQTVHCILKKKYINQYTTKTHNFLFLLYLFIFSFPMCGAYTLQSTWDGKHQSKHMNLRHVNIVSHKVTSGNTALLYTFQNKDGRSQKWDANFVSNGRLFFFPLKRTTEKTFQRHAKWFSPFDAVILWSEWVLRARNRAAHYKIHWKRDVRCGFLCWLSA